MLSRDRSFTRIHRQLRPHRVVTLALAFALSMAPLLPEGKGGVARAYSGELVGLVSVNAAGAGGGNADSGDGGRGMMSADGRFIVFTSRAKDLVTLPDLNDANDVFVRDRALNRTTLVSFNAAGNRTGHGESSRPAITPDGRYVVFVSLAGDLVTGVEDSNNVEDVFVRDLERETTELISVDRTHTEAANGGSSGPVITPDGRYVAFKSTATNLIRTPDQNGELDVFVRDRSVRTTTLASVNRGNRAAANGSSSGDLRMTHDGRYVAFESFATDLVSADDTNQTRDVFVRDLRAMRTHPISRRQDADRTGDDTSELSAMTPDGRFVVFHSVASDIVLAPSNPHPHYTEQLYVRDLTTGGIIVVSLSSDGSELANNDCTGATISDDGRRVTFVSEASNLVPLPIGDIGERWNVYSRDLSTGETTLVSVNYSGTASGNGFSYAPVASSDGLFVAFQSEASDLVDPGFADTNGTYDVFLRDLVTGTTTLLSRSLDGNFASANSPSWFPYITPNGRFVAFSSNATDLVFGDENNSLDVFVAPGEFTPGELRFSTPTTTRAENAGAVTLAVRRLGGSDGTVTVDYTIGGGTATAGQDYVLNPGRLRFGPGETSKTITVTLVDDTLAEPRETIQLTLSNPTAGATLGGTHQALLEIRANDQP